MAAPVTSSRRHQAHAVAPPSVPPRWQTAELFPSARHWQVAAGAAEQEISDALAAVARPRTAAQLLALLHRHEQILVAANGVILYADCADATIGGATATIAAGGRRIQSLLDNVTASVDGAIQLVPDGELAAWLAQEPGLRRYAVHLARLRATGRAGAPARQAAAGFDQLAAAAHRIYERGLARDLWPGGDQRGRQSLALSWAGLQSPERRVRQASLTRYARQARRGRHTAAAALTTCMRAQLAASQQRGYPGTLAAAAQYYEIPRAVVTGLVSGVRRRRDVLASFLAYRRSVHGLDRLRAHDLFAPLAPGATGGIAFDEAMELVRGATAPLGDGYLADLDRIRWRGLLEVREPTGGQATSYTERAPGCPPMVLVRYSGDWSDVRTLSHELGHAVHTLRSAAQPPCYAVAGRLVAEVAATVNEVLLAEHAAGLPGHVAGLADHADLLVGRVFRHVLLLEFELWAHEQVAAGRDLDADELDDRYAALLADYYGAAADTRGLAAEWMRVPHLFWNHTLLVYPLAALLALWLARPAAAGETAYLDLLAAGSSRPAADLLRQAGADLTDLTGPLDELGLVVARLRQPAAALPVPQS